MGEHTAGGTSVDDLVQRLREIADAVDAARAFGVHAEVPQSLRDACAALVARATPPGGDGGGRRISTAWVQPPYASMAGGQLDVDVARQMPLRRLLWQVISPGEEFTVSVVVDRLAELGAEWPANKVSNALGYWVQRDRLDRPRKGHYLYPVDAPSPVDDLDGPDAARELPGGVADRGPTAVQGKELPPHVDETGRRAAAM